MKSITEKLYKDLEELEGIINYSFKDKDNLILALTHSSYANENKRYNLISNERLEFLGDAVLNIVISEKIYLKYKNFNEGEMTKARSLIVCETSLIRCANKINLAKFLLLGKGEELTGGRSRPSIISDAFEALIGAVYIDGGMRNARKFINIYMKEIIGLAINGDDYLDFKTQFQEVVQSKGERKISYEVLEEKGPDHDKTFISQVKVENKPMGIGKGKNKKEAEQNAAKNALIKMGVR
ncbi:MAG TPA: ribonuclease III [Clostridiaceae bacterium]|jgi:ribonuclease-3|nr:ribonuclease III [Clostridiaceae bacterium]